MAYGRIHDSPVCRDVVLFFSLHCVERSYPSVMVFVKRLNLEKLKRSEDVDVVGYGATERCA